MSFLACLFPLHIAVLLTASQEKIKEESGKIKTSSFRYAGGLRAQSKPFLADDQEMRLAFILRQVEGFSLVQLKITVILPLLSKGY